VSSDSENGLIRLVRLMTEPEKAELRSDLGIAPEADDDALLDAVARLPKYEAVRAFLRAADATMVLLQEVFGYTLRPTSFAA
jgi:hypothetical protein